jgi:hypothetical protein
MRYGAVKKTKSPMRIKLKIAAVMALNFFLNRKFAR